MNSAIGNDWLTVPVSPLKTYIPKTEHLIVMAGSYEPIPWLKGGVH